MTHSVEETASIHRLPMERVADYFENVVSEVPSKRDLYRDNRKRVRTATVTICIVGLIAIGSLILGYSNAQQVGVVAAGQAINTGSIEALSQARDQLRAAGVPEAQLPAPIVIQQGEPVDVDALVQATTATIVAKIRTDPNFRGQSGIDGLNGNDGATPPCIFLPNMCKGDQGIPGTVGPAGPAGVAGQAGPAGVQGDQGVAGERGPMGLTGDTGPIGPKGDIGQACPNGQSLKEITVVTKSATINQPEQTALITACQP